MKKKKPFQGLFPIAAACAALLFVGYILVSNVGLPAYDGPPEEKSDLYANPETVTVSGFDASMMEPFISPDGKYLFFNNKNDPKIDTNLHVAVRTGPLAFKYIGPLSGANSEKLDAAASIDTSGHVYFTSVRQYEKDFKSIFTGKFDGKDVGGVHTVEGDITPDKTGVINMDVSIQPDGKTLYISRAHFGILSKSPLESDLMVAHRKGDKFFVDPRTDEIMKNVNTHALEYAPAISADGLELYFTRASKPLPGSHDDKATLRIMVATRKSEDAPFDLPKTLSALTGFVEAPSLTLDRREMFYHKKIDGKFVIYRAERKSS